ncbi:helix-turn-helix domain-containing protein [Solimonas soli]|uniref:helix-turn-helix domain-containing protein n=1 Tax=Solimonas soli TaxID=413479 RepID=UPI0004B389A8|nr:helix-turn-helix transcriptional regulator [Solimonas soli]
MSDAIHKAFGRIIRRARELQGWSQEKLAEAANLNRSYLGEVERGLVSPSLATIAKLAQALRQTPSSLFDALEEETVD